MAHAFMHSPIPKCLSPYLSTTAAWPTLFSRALNGLRDASLAWLNLLSESIKAVGLFLDAVFKEFNISKGSAAIPDVAAHIEKTVDDVHAQVPLSAEAYARFRRALGKLLWMAQVRHDIKIYLSLIGSQQASPMNGTESAIRAILRFLYNDMSTMLSIPSP